MLMSNTSGTLLTDLPEKTLLDGAEELYISDPLDNSDKKTSVDDIRRLNSERFIYAEDYGVNSENVDNTDQINIALSQCTQQGMALVLPNKGELKVQGALVFPNNVPYLTICSLDGLATIDITGHEGTLITLSQRGHGVRNLIIKSTTRTGIAINFGGGIGIGSSQLFATNLRVINVAKGLIFDNCHDVHDISHIELFGNGSDIEFNNNQSTSVKMYAVRMMESDKAITINQALSDFHFIGGIIAPTPIDDTIDSCFTVNNVPIFGGSIQGTRFEVKGGNGTGRRFNQMSLSGQSSANPITGFKIQDNYFSGHGSVKNHILLASSTEGVLISNNFFFAVPDEYDINMSFSNEQDDIGHGNLGHNRDIKVFYKSNLYYRARNWKPMKRVVDRHTVIVSPGAEEVGYVETTVVWPVPFLTRTLSAKTFFRSGDSNLKTGEPYLASFGNASSVFRIPVYDTGSLDSTLKFDVEAYGF